MLTYYLQASMAFAFRLLYKRMCSKAWKPSSLPNDVTVTDHELALEGRILPIRIFEYKDKFVTSKKPLLLYYHGGGACSGDLTVTHYHICVVMASKLRCTVLAADYRLAPQHYFPAGPHDAVDSLENVAADIRNYSCNHKIIVAGDSYGAMLAFIACSRAKATNDALAGMALFYPMVETSDSGYDSWTTMAKGHIVTADLMHFFWWCYLGVNCKTFAETHNAEECQLAFPLHSPDSMIQESIIPPTFLATAEYDVLRDEGRALGHKLKSNGIAVTQHHYPAEHGFFCNAGENESQKECMQHLNQWFDSLC